MNKHNEDGFWKEHGAQLTVATVTGLSALAVGIVMRRRMEQQVLDAVLIADAIEDRLIDAEQPRSRSIVCTTENW
jgi:hypothetical protein